MGGLSDDAETPGDKLLSCAESGLPADVDEEEEEAEAEDEFEFATGSLKELDEDCLDAMVCYDTEGNRRFKRVGNFTVLWEERLANGRRKLHCVVGPYWKVMVFITTPLVTVVPLILCFSYLSYHHLVVVILFIR